MLWNSEMSVVPAGNFPTIPWVHGHSLVTIIIVITQPGSPGLLN